MEQQPQTHRLTWRGIEILVIHTPKQWNAIAHLSIRSIAPEGASLPISSTGYLPHYHPCGTVEALGGDVVGQVKAWLDEQATKPEWKALVERSRQGELF